MIMKVEKLLAQWVWYEITRQQSEVKVQRLERSKRLIRRRYPWRNILVYNDEGVIYLFANSAACKILG